MTVKRRNPDWVKKARSEFKAQMPSKAMNAMMRVESESKRIVYLGHPEHLNKDSATLSRSITTEIVPTSSDDVIRVVVGTNIVYAATHEFGDTRLGWGRVMVHIPDRPYLRPALRTKKSEVELLIQTAFNGIIRGAAK